jgi:hypothetical protein
VVQKSIESVKSLLKWIFILTQPQKRKKLSKEDIVRVVILFHHGYFRQCHNCVQVWHFSLGKVDIFHAPEEKVLILEQTFHQNG